MGAVHRASFEHFLERVIMRVKRESATKKEEIIHVQGKVGAVRVSLDMESACYLQRTHGMTHHSPGAGTFAMPPAGSQAGPREVVVLASRAFTSVGIGMVIFVAPVPGAGRSL